MTINWKSAARAFRLRSEADRMMLDAARESLAMLRDEWGDAEFDSWEDAARHWWERMRQAELARDRWVEAAHRVGAENRLVFEERDELRSRLVDISEDFSSLEYDAARVVSALNGDPDRLRDAIEIMRDNGRSGWWHAKPSNIPGEFADLAARIAKADGKYPMDCEDVEPTKHTDSILDYARKRLAAAPTWDNALRCELAEALDALACEEMDAFTDELLDVATVAMRWRRAVLERGKR